ncbi:hypothetical protein ABZ896_08895 [Streptomyces sp. NPDC047072]|uniref:phosphorylase family protein n=1 Tax=Streptomyces sp. NPDC047072 TaxID=3154809 RepID=UPI0033F847D3
MADTPTVVILTALPVEYAAVRAHLTDTKTLKHVSGTLVERGRLPGTPWYVALAEIGVGTLTAATITERVNSWLAPRFLLVVGVAGGLKNDIDIGDVVVATKVYGIHGGKHTPEGFLVRPEAWHASHRLEQAARHALRGTTGYRAHFGAIAVGDVVVADTGSEITRHIHEHYNDAAAIEMEGAGAVQAAHLIGTLDTLVVRGISDKADSDKSRRDAEGSQPRAARNAAAAAVATLHELARTETHERVPAETEAADLPARAVAERWTLPDRRMLLNAIGVLGLAVADTILTFPGRSADPAAASAPGASGASGASGKASAPGASGEASNTAAPAVMAPLGDPLMGHTDRVYSVAFRPGGRVLASGSADQTVRFWDLADPSHPKPIGSPLTGPTDTVYSVAFAPDGNLLADASADQKIRLLNVADPARPVLLSSPVTGHTDAAFSVAFSPSGELLAGGSGDRTIRLWRITDPAHPELLGGPVYGHTDAVLSVAFSHDEDVMGSGGSDHAVRLWNVADPPAPVGPALPGHTGRVYSVAFSPDGHLLASGSEDRTIRLWKVTDPANPVFLGRATGHGDAVNSVAFSPDGKVLASGSSDTTVRLWRVTDSAGPAPLGRPLTGHRGAVFTVAFNPDGDLLASGSADQTVRLWKRTR